MAKRHLIIGSSAGGIGCALRLRMLAPDDDVTVLTAESDYPYNKCLLADVLLGEKQSEDIIFCPSALLSEKGINFVTQARVASLDTVSQFVQCTDGKRFSYDTLCIATGRSPLMLPLFAHKNFKNLFNFYHKSDVDQIITHINIYKPRNALVIGAGLTGLEAADGLRARGCAVTVVESAQQVLANLVNTSGAAVITTYATAVAIRLLTGDRVTGYTEYDDCITQVHTEQHGTIPVDLIVCAIGAKPNTDFLPPSVLNEQGYCMVDGYMRTTVLQVYAVGDCCAVYDILSGATKPSSLWPDAMQQGMHAAYSMVGLEKMYAGTLQIASSSFFGLKVACAGSVTIPDGCQAQEVDGSGWYHRFTYKNGQLCGFILIGNTSDFAQYRRQLLSKK